MKSLKNGLRLVVLCLFFVSGCTDNQALRDIKNQMQAEKEQKEIDARADVIVRDFMQLRESGLRKIRGGGSSADQDKVMMEFLNTIEERGKNGDKAVRRALEKIEILTR